MTAELEGEMNLKQIILTFVKDPDARWSIFAVVLLAALLGWIPSPMTRQQEQQQLMLNLLQNQILSLQAHDRNSMEARVEASRQQNYANMLLRTLCRSVAPAQRQMECEPRYGGYEEKEK